MKKAFCPPEIEENPVLQVLMHHIFPRAGSVTIERPEKFGGNRTFDSYADLEQAYAAGEVHPADLKNATTESLIKILAPVRAYLQE
jgi:tyrosyl-tRNA synthetase